MDVSCGPHLEGSGTYLFKESVEGYALVASKGEQLAGRGSHVRDGAKLREDHEDGRHGRCALRRCIVKYLLSLTGFLTS